MKSQPLKLTVKEIVRRLKGKDGQYSPRLVSDLPGFMHEELRLIFRKWRKIGDPLSNWDFIEREDFEALNIPVPNVLNALWSAVEQNQEKTDLMIYMQAAARALELAALEALRRGDQERAKQIALVGYKPEKWRGKREEIAERIAWLFIFSACAVDYYRALKTFVPGMIDKYRLWGDRWCTTLPCTCDEDRHRFFNPCDLDSGQVRWSAAEWQKHMVACFGLKNVARGLGYTLFRVNTEHVEFANASNPLYGGHVPMSEIRDEVPDLFIWLFVAANAVGVDAQYAINWWLSSSKAHQKRTLLEQISTGKLPF